MGRWDARGWKIDTDALQARKGKTAFAIPCPARRNSGNWAIDPVPLVPGARAA